MGVVADSLKQDRSGLKDTFGPVASVVLRRPSWHFPKHRSWSGLPGPSGIVDSGRSAQALELARFVAQSLGDGEAECSIVTSSGFTVNVMHIHGAVLVNDKSIIH